MTRVPLTNYEVDHDLLPPVCARCGAAADDRAVLTLRVIDGWAGLPQFFGLLAGVFFFPPLILLALHFARAIRARVPHCTPHADEFRRRERVEWRVLLPIWTTAVVIVDAVVVFQLVTVGPGMICLAPFFVMVATLSGAVVNVRRQVKLSKDTTGLRLHDVHPAFVAALVEERARDRVSNPDRRGGHGDVRDGYDDEVM